MTDTPHSRRIGLPILLTLVLLSLFTGRMEAQTHYSSNIAIGVKGGVDGSHVFFNPGVKQLIPIGATVGFQFRYVEENHFGLIAEVNFAQKGWKENYEEAPLSYRRTVNYLEIPLLSHIYFGRRGKFFLNIGPQIGIMLSESTKSNFDYEHADQVAEYPYKNRVHDQLTLPVAHKLDFGINAGLGGEFNISRRHSVSLEARFYYGIGNMFASGRRDPFRVSNSMSVALTAGYWLRIK